MQGKVCIYLLLFGERGSYMIWVINMGVCPRLAFDNMLFNSLRYGFYIYGAFEFLCNSIDNL